MNSSNSVSESLLNDSRCFGDFMGLRIPDTPVSIEKCGEFRLLGLLFSNGRYGLDTH